MYILQTGIDKGLVQLDEAQKNILYTACNKKYRYSESLHNGIGYGSAEFHVFRAKPDIDIGYIHGLLRLHSLREYAVLYFSGSAGHQRVSDEFFKRPSIPLPPLEKQKTIAAEIKKRRAEAKKLKEEAAAELVEAKKSVEKMILGTAQTFQVFKNLEGLLYCNYRRRLSTSLATPLKGVPSCF